MLISLDRTVKTTKDLNDNFDDRIYFFARLREARLERLTLTVLRAAGFFAGFFAGLRAGLRAAGFFATFRLAFPPSGIL